MRYKAKLKLILSGLVFSSFLFAGANNTNIEDIDVTGCLDKNACPKMLEISLVNPIKKEGVKAKNTSNEISLESVEVAFPLLIKNKSKRALTTVITANHNNNKVNCGRFTVPGNSSITGEIACNVGGIPYSLQDADGRSNVITVSTGGGPCAGKSINEECRSYCQILCLSH